MRTIHGLTSQPAPLATDELPLWSGSTTKKVTVADIVAAADPKPHTHDLSDITDAGSAAAASTSDFDTAGAAAAVYSAPRHPCGDEHFSARRNCCEHGRAANRFEAMQ
jgi:hypothetical protein